MADGRHPFGVRRSALATVNDNLPPGAKRVQDRFATPFGEVVPHDLDRLRGVGGDVLPMLPHCRDPDPVAQETFLIRPDLQLAWRPQDDGRAGRLNTATISSASAGSRYMRDAQPGYGWPASSPPRPM